jgi:hypothetical protein
MPELKWNLPLIPPVDLDPSPFSGHNTPPQQISFTYLPKYVLSEVRSENSRSVQPDVLVRYCPQHALKLTKEQDMLCLCDPSFDESEYILPSS